MDGRVRVKGVPGKELTLGALATVANPIRYAYGKEASDAALKLVKPRAGAVLADGEEPGLEAFGYYAPAAVDVRQRLSRRDRGGRSRHRRGDDPQVRRASTTAGRW